MEIRWNRFRGKKSSPRLRIDDLVKVLDKTSGDVDRLRVAAMITKALMVYKHGVALDAVIQAQATIKSGGENSDNMSVCLHFSKQAIEDSPIEMFDDGAGKAKRRQIYTQAMAAAPLKQQRQRIPLTKALKPRSIWKSPVKPGKLRLDP